MKLSTNFYLSELTQSQAAIRRNIQNNPNEEQIEALKELVTNVLQPLRDLANSPIIISSGYRCPELNRMIGGAANSQHTMGEAADFMISGMDAIEGCRFILNSGIVFDQLIYEGSWIHVSYKKDNNRRKVLTAHFGYGVRYTEWLPNT
jgi:zinc D-Ala-D-Ala carboxypeptidase